jgi:type IV secretory pathway VirB10-like protein
VSDVARPAKLSAESVLRAPRRPVTRYRPWVIGSIVLALFLLVGLGFMVAFGQGQPRRAAAAVPPPPAAAAAAELDHRLPVSYDDPLALAGPQTAVSPIPAATAPSPARPPAGPSPAELQRSQELIAAHGSGPFFMGGASGPPGTIAPVAATPSSRPAPPTASATGSSKERFVAGAATDQEISPHLAAAPLSRFEVKAGAIIPAALLTGLNSDLPGPVIAQVTEPVFDHLTGRRVLIPQGARLIGRYDSQVSYGQDRALVVWTRIVFPDGRSLNIGAMTGADTTGAGGLTDRIDDHIPVLARAIGFSTLISIGGAAAQNSIGRGSNNLVLQDGAGGLASAASQTGQKLVDRDLQRAPTLRVRPGWPLRLIVDTDLVFTS